MAPPQQQNSTFIDDNLDTCPSLALLNLPESPILPTKRRQNQDNDNNNNNHNQNNKQTAVEGPALGLGPQQSCKNKHSQANGNGGHHQHQQRQPRHRSISLYGVNSTVQQGQKEIPIWMDDGEPRYVSGVTNKTTCNDIIKALIDDELKTGNPALASSLAQATPTFSRTFGPANKTSHASRVEYIFSHQMAEKALSA